MVKKVLQIVGDQSIETEWSQLVCIPPHRQGRLHPTSKLFWGLLFFLASFSGFDFFLNPKRSEWPGEGLFEARLLLLLLLLLILPELMAISLEADKADCWIRERVLWMRDCWGNAETASSSRIQALISARKALFSAILKSKKARTFGAKT